MDWMFAMLYTDGCTCGLCCMLMYCDCVLCCILMDCGCVQILHAGGLTGCVLYVVCILYADDCGLGLWAILMGCGCVLYYMQIRLWDRWWAVVIVVVGSRENYCCDADGLCLCVFLCWRTVLWLWAMLYANGFVCVLWFMLTYCGCVPLPYDGSGRCCGLLLYANWLWLCVPCCGTGSKLGRKTWWLHFCLEIMFE